ncbi:hypothetical protein WN50_36560 [Limnoraphis robusta CS-951]|uniref:ABC transmembrane type-1 domain-containing protein n=1 Tax=Limnoraphis robusta CS-951 TaxID=1637645 RepID=A0A0J9EWD4_9CYAN|nr:hypothetical protein WN50_36560 [Limnoraphis robusta CS-951]
MAYSRLQKLASYIRPHWKQSLLGIFTLLLVNGLGVYIPLLIRNGINDLENAIDLRKIIGLVFLIFGLASLMWVIRMVSRILIFGVGYSPVNSQWY